MLRICSLLIILVGFYSCQESVPPPPPPVMASDSTVTPEDAEQKAAALPQDFESLVSTYENVEREEWQKPEQVIDFLGDLDGKVVADIGAGSGYFSYRMLNRGARVIATDIDERFIMWLDDHVDIVREELQQNFETRLATPSDNALKKEELDAAIMINTISYIPQRQKYLRDLSTSMKSGAILLLVDYKSQRVPVPAPDLKDRSVVGMIEKDMLASGFSNISVDDCTLDFQWILMAEKK